MTSSSPEIVGYARGEDGGGSACGEGEDAGGEEEAHEVAIDDEDYKNGEVGGGDSNTPFAYKYGEARLNQHPLRRVGIE